MKEFVIFLDVDGVLNNWDWIKFYNNNLKSSQYFEKYISPKNVKMLDYLLKKIEQRNFKPKIVVASTAWRDDKYIELIKILRRYHLGYSGTYDKTTTQENGDRLNQIKRYIKEFNEIETNNPITDNFVIVDDETKNMQGRIDDKFILTATGIFEQGLTKENVDGFINRYFEKDNQKSSQDFFE